MRSLQLLPWRSRRTSLPCEGPSRAREGGRRTPSTGRIRGREPCLPRRHSRSLCADRSTSPEHRYRCHYRSIAIAIAIVAVRFSLDEERTHRAVPDHLLQGEHSPGDPAEIVTDGCGTGSDGLLRFARGLMKPPAHRRIVSGRFDCKRAFDARKWPEKAAYKGNRAVGLPRSRTADGEYSPVPPRARAGRRLRRNAPLGRSAAGVCPFGQ